MIVIVEVLLDPIYFFLRGFKLSTGELFTAKQFFKHCESVKGKYYTEILGPINSAMDLSGVPYKKSGDYKLTIGQATIISLNAWAMGLKADEESLEKIDRIVDNFGIAITPGMGTVKDYSLQTRSQNVSKLLLGEVLCSFTDDNKLVKNGVPAYRPALLCLSASTKKHYKNIKSYDIVSAYPAACISYNFPSGESLEVNELNLKINSEGTIHNENWSSEKLGYIGKFKATGIKRKNWVKLCSLQFNQDLEEQYRSVKVDSIGILSGDLVFNAATPELRLFLLQFDYEEIEVLELYTHKLSKLPHSTTAIIRYWYDKKVNGDHIEKLKLNALIGCWGRSPLKFPSIPVESIKDAERTLAIYNGSETKNPSCLGTIRTWDFRWAIYAVSYVRLALGKIEKALYDRGCKVLYCDTDSIKFTGDEGAVFENYSMIMKNAINQGDLGTFRDESSSYSDGALFYSKRAYLKSSGGVIKPTIAGVNKALAEEQLLGMKLKEFEGKSLKIFTPIWIVTELPDEKLGMKFLPQKAYGKITIN